MMVFKMTVEMDNAAFECDAGRPELRRILKEEVADRLCCHVHASIRDANGNMVGSWKLIQD